MARANRRRRRPVATGTVVVPWREVAAVKRATAAILRTHREAAKVTALAAIEIGRQVAAIKTVLDHGELAAWIESELPFEQRTAERYMALAKWADDHPREARRFASLGPSKLYRIAALSPTRRRRLDLATPIRIPGAGRKTLDAMTVAELDRAIGDLAPAVTAPASDKVLAGFRHRLAGLVAWGEQLVAHADDYDASVGRELAAEIHALAETVSEAFE